MAVSKVKKIAAWLHLWIGLATGLVVVVVSLTGCIYVFEEEIFNIVHKDLVVVEKTGQPRPISELLANAQKSLGKEKLISNLRMTGDQRSYVFSGYQINDKKKINLSYFSQFVYMDNVYINQYTGQVLGVIDMRYEFFNVVEQLHRQLLLVKPVGSVIVGSCILLFLILLITGFILWLPKNYRQFKKSISIKWNAKWKRVNYDLHNSVGFYVLPVAMLIAITGLVWSFKWWEAGIYKMLGTDKKPDFKSELPLISAADSTLNKIDLIQHKLLKQLNGNWDEISMGIPEEKNKISMCYVKLNRHQDYWNGVSYYFYDGRTGSLISELPHEKKTLGMKWRNSNQVIHTGKIYGTGTQILAFCVSLLCATLPISGFLIWWGKRNKKKRKQNPANSLPAKLQA